MKIHIQFEYDNIIYNIMNVYGQNIVAERAEFFQFLYEYMKSFENIIITGDWNTTLSNLDRSSRTEHKSDIAVRNLECIIQDHNVYDIWRFRNPDKLVFSKKAICSGELKQSRIDYYLLNYKRPYVFVIYLPLLSNCD